MGSAIIQAVFSSGGPHCGTWLAPGATATSQAILLRRIAIPGVAAPPNPFAIRSADLVSESSKMKVGAVR